MWGHLPDTRPQGVPRFASANTDVPLDRFYHSGIVANEPRTALTSFDIPWPRVFMFDGCLGCLGTDNVATLFKDPTSGGYIVRNVQADVISPIPVDPAVDALLMDSNATWVAPIEPREDWREGVPGAVVFDLSALSALGRVADNGGSLLSLMNNPSLLQTTTASAPPGGTSPSLSSAERSQIARRPARLQIPSRSVRSVLPPSRLRGPAPTPVTRTESSTTTSASSAGGLWSSSVLAAYSAHRGEVFLAAAGVSKIYRYDVLQATWSSVPLTGESPPETLLAITWREADRSVYILGTATVLGKTWIRLYQASLDGALTLRGSWLSTGSAVAYSLAVLPHQELVLLGSSSMGYTGAFLLDADTVEVTPVQEVWVYGTLHPFVAAVPERRALGYFASDSKKGVSPMTAPWSWWYAPYPGDLQYLF